MMMTVIIITVVVITGITIMAFDLWSPWGIVKKSIAGFVYPDKAKKKTLYNNRLVLLPFS
jgi:hypothetical protein